MQEFAHADGDADFCMGVFAHVDADFCITMHNLLFFHTRLYVRKCRWGCPEGQVGSHLKNPAKLRMFSHVRKKNSLIAALYIFIPLSASLSEKLLLKIVFGKHLATMSAKIESNPANPYEKILMST